jgi:ubiquinone/menaquinone biosynthesis C-methylase UbiE
MGYYQDRILPHLLNLAMRNKHLVPYRKRTLALAYGRVLEIGIGSGQNLFFYSERVTELLGLDPHPKLLEMAYAKPSALKPNLVEGSAETLPLKDKSVDTVVTTWALCSIPNVAAALEEARRVVKPNGQFLFVEHGLSTDESGGRWQHRLTPVWKRLAGGCHLDRPISELVGKAGFEITQMATSYIKGPKPMTFTYEGTARPV